MRRAKLKFAGTATRVPVRAAWCARSERRPGVWACIVRGLRGFAFWPDTPVLLSGGFAFARTGAPRPCHQRVAGGTKAGTLRYGELGQAAGGGGLRFGDAVEATVFLVDIEDVWEMNDSRASLFPA